MNYLLFSLSSFLLFSLRSKRFVFFPIVEVVVVIVVADVVVAFGVNVVVVVRSYLTFLVGGHFKGQYFCPCKAFLFRLILRIF